MKNSGTDRELFDLIKSTLDNYEEDYILGAWENFSNKRKKRKKIILWWFGAGIAASIMIGWLGFRLTHPDPVNYFVNTDQPIENEIQNLSSQNTFSSQIKNSVLKNSLDTHVNVGTVHTIHAESNQGLYSDNSAVNQIIVMHIPDTLRITQSSITEPVDTGKISLELNQSDSIQYKPFSLSLDPQIKAEENVANVGVNRKIRFGVNFSPGVNSTSTASSFNYSGGLSADIVLFSNFQLSTGLQVEHQSVVNSEANKNTTVPQEQKKASLVNLDLPLNITWKFLSKKSSIYYLSGGISSLVYLSEKYINTTYSQKVVEIITFADGIEKVDYKVVNVKSTEQKTEAPFNTFDFAGRVNILFGLQQPISSNLFIHIEPYIKIPVSGLATQNLKFTTSGITCKISF